MILIIIICSEIPRPHIFQIDVQGNTQSTHLQDRYAVKDPDYTSLREMCRETQTVHILKAEAQVNTQSTHHYGRCARKLPKYISLRYICKEVLSRCIFQIDVSENARVHVFQIDVQGNTQSTHLSDEILSGKYSVESSFRTV